MPVGTPTEALKWAHRELEATRRVLAVMASHGPSAQMGNDEREHRRKLGWALNAYAHLTGDKSTPETGTDDEIAAFIAAKMELHNHE